MHDVDTTTPSSVTVLGLGLMGRALAGAFLDADLRTTVWNRTAARADPPAGALRAGSAREAAAASPLVVVCVTDHDAARAVVEPLADVLAGRVLVNLSSGTSDQGRELAAWAAAHGIGFLDGVISVAPAAIGGPEAVVLYSGSRAAFDAHEPVLRRLGGGTGYVGEDAGSAALYEMATLSLMWGTLNGFLHGAALLGAAGVDAVSFAPVADRAVATTAGWLAGFAGQIDAGDYPADGSPIDVHLAAMGHLVRESEARGVDAELPRLWRAVAEEAVARGRGGEGYAALVDRYRPGARGRGPAGAQPPVGGSIGPVPAADAR
ncbi:NAD(P)-dependent oxidoreductase [Pseudonocardia humida]|uniref:NAD(P)-dependent oxidoreductase n=1 Tax=Pseudonocardia humida TaxID=2800819 RepID=A0ABT1A1R0_9PSEU|nr:NAD(P)-binding domain-containing protein [Pseudonocardia humida]MCO1656925.1 NAD(P)-dependent oxidoreductase [Pseudonocardia humida]